MSRWGPLRREIIANSLVLFCVAAFPAPTRPQSQEVMIRGTGQIVPVCKPADLDSNVIFVSNQTDFIVAFNLQNISENPCVLQPTGGLPMFDLEQLQKTKPFDLCMDCEDRLPNGQYRVHDPVVLNSGKIAHQTYRWKTVAPAKTVICLPLRALFDPVLVVAPTLFKPVCSEIAVSRTYAGEFVPTALKDQPNTDEVQSGEVFVLSSRKPRYYQDEMFTLHVALVDSVAGPPSGAECPTLFLRERSPDGATRFDEVSPMGLKPVKPLRWVQTGMRIGNPASKWIPACAADGRASVNTALNFSSPWGLPATNRAHTTHAYSSQLDKRNVSSEVREYFPQTIISDFQP